MSESRDQLQQTICLVTVLYNCERHLPLFFKCLAQQDDRDFLVILIDNASADQSLDIARQLANTYGVPCNFISNSENLGVATANNQGIQSARNQGIAHILLINNDIACDSNLITAIRKRAIDRGHRAWTCFAYLRDSNEPWYGGGRLSYLLARGFHFSSPQVRTITEPISVTYAPTCLMYVHASVFDAIGMMDPRYFVYYDDTDFCKRMQMADITLVYDPEVQFRHYVGGSTGGDRSDFFLRISTRNKLLYISKHYAPPMRWIVMGIAIASKIVQLASPIRRNATWQGLMDAFKLSH